MLVRGQGSVKFSVVGWLLTVVLVLLSGLLGLVVVHLGVSGLLEERFAEIVVNFSRATNRAAQIAIFLGRHGAY